MKLDTIRRAARGVRDHLARAVFDDWVPRCFGEMPAEAQLHSDFGHTCRDCPWWAECAPTTREHQERERAARARQAAERPRPVVKPACFGREDTHDHRLAECQGCRWFQTCAVIVKNKRAERPRWPQPQEAALARPRCFGDPVQRDEDSHICLDCRFFQTCGLLVRNKRRA